MLLVPPPSPPLLPAANFTPSRRLELPRRVLATQAVASSEVDAFTQYSGYLFELSSTEAESLTEYKISRITAIYQKKPFILLRRLFQTATTLGKWFALRYYDSVTDRGDLMFEVRIMSRVVFLLVTSEFMPRAIRWDSPCLNFYYQLDISKVVEHRLWTRFEFIQNCVFFSITKTIGWLLALHLFANCCYC